MTGQVSNRREQHKQHTRAVLEETALELFAKAGYEQTTVEQIATGAGVSIRTFFRYFSSKQHVLFGDVAHSRVRLLRDALRARPATEEPLASIRIVLAQADITDPAELAQIGSRMRLMTAQPALLGTYLMLNEELRHQVAEFVAERYAISPTHPYPLLLSAATAAAWDCALWSWSAGHSTDLAGLRRDAFSQLTAGLRPPAS